MDKDEQVVRILLEIRAQLEVVYDKVDDALEELLAPMEDDEDEQSEDDGEGPGVAGMDPDTPSGDLLGGNRADEGQHRGDPRTGQERQLAVVAQSLRAATVGRKRGPYRRRRRASRARRR